MRTKTTPINTPEAIQARAALAELFGDAPPAAPSVQETSVPVGEHGAQQVDASKMSAKIDTLRRKREARDALLQAAAARGISLDELREMIADEDTDH